MTCAKCVLMHVPTSCRPSLCRQTGLSPRLLVRPLPLLLVLPRPDGRAATMGRGVSSREGCLHGGKGRLVGGSPPDGFAQHSPRRRNYPLRCRPLPFAPPPSRAVTRLVNMANALDSAMAWPAWPSLMRSTPDMGVSRFTGMNSEDTTANAANAMPMTLP